MARKEIYQREDGSRGVRTVIEGDSMTEQQFAEDCDVNVIMAKYMKTGHVGHLRLRDQGVYLDLVDAPDFHDAMQTLVTAQTAFDQLPADVRLRFGNDPGSMIQFLSDENNREEAIKLGLISKKQEPQPDPVVETLQDISRKLDPKKTTAD